MYGVNYKDGKLDVSEMIPSAMTSEQVKETNIDDLLKQLRTQGDSLLKDKGDDEQKKIHDCIDDIDKELRELDDLLQDVHDYKEPQEERIYPDQEE